MLKDDFNYFSEQIKNIKTIDIAKLVGVSRNMAEKYKKFSNYPTLDKAVLIEDEFNIPARTWVDIRKFKENNK
jgi:transcriptional regulator with XRE-family HTH domain